MRIVYLPLKSTPDMAVEYNTSKACFILWKINMNDPAKDNALENITTPIDDHFYKLVDKKPVRCNLAEYARFMQQESNRIVMQHQINELRVSTIFTGIDHAFGTGEKQLFETMIFGMENGIHPTWQHATWNEAVKKHEEIVKNIQTDGINILKQQIHEKADKSR